MNSTGSADRGRVDAPRGVARGPAIVAMGAVVGLLFGVVECAYALYFAPKNAGALLWSALLVLSVDALAGALASAGVFVFSRALAFSGPVGGRRAEWLSTTLVAALSAPLWFYALGALAQRKHRELVSLVLSLAMAVAVPLLLVLARGAVRVVVDRRSNVEGPRGAPCSLTELAASATIASLAALAVATSRNWPLVEADRRTILAVLVAATALAPWVARSALSVLDRVAPSRASSLVGVLCAGAVLVALARVRDTLALVPTGAAGLVAAPFILVFARVFAWNKLRRALASPRGKAALAAALAIAVTLVALGERSESARKVVATRTVGAESVLRVLRRALDFDGDGYSRWVPGGDCRDNDPAIHPGAMDWPGDGIDADCDGRDDVVHPPRSYPFVEVPSSVPQRPNVLLLTIDALRADHLGAYGYARPTSPALDRLARESTVFDRAFANAPSTRLSMPTIATGRWAPAIEWDHTIFWPRFTQRQRTTAEVLRELGYRTGAVYSIPYFRRTDARGFERGVDEYDDSLIGLHAEIGGPAESSGTSSREVADHALAFVQRNASRPWFLWAHFFDPHHQYVSHDDGETTFFGTAPVDRYDSEVQYTDRHIGRLLDALRSSEQWSRTVVIVTGDHGEGFGEHDVNTHGFHLYAAQTRVPMIVRVPGANARRERAPVSHVDVAPTIVNLARAGAPPTFLGRTMVDAVAGAGRGDDDGDVIQEVTFDNTTHRWGIVSSTHHVLWNQSPEATRECFDLRTDPDERQDLFGVPALGAPCDALFEQLTRATVALRVGPDFARRLAFAVIGADAPRPTPEHALDAKVGDSLRVVGWDGPTALTRTIPATFTVHYDAIGTIPRGWEVFVHLLGERVSRNLDHPLLEGAYPIERWQPGQRLRDRWTTTLSLDVAPGRYAFVLGLFRGDQRMPVEQHGRADPHRRVMLGWIEVR
ncbi:MAG: sulfatase-like hydrolase/transferase [Myxococcales bacterium]|nr:sulfatase-like hydrolase/transferase [Myxococcales bacterium]